MSHHLSAVGWRRSILWSILCLKLTIASVLRSVDGRRAVFDLHIHLLLCQRGSSRCILEEPVNWADGFAVVHSPADRMSFLHTKKHPAADQRGSRGESCAGVSDRSLLGMKPSWGIYFDELMSPIPEMNVWRPIRVSISVVWWLRSNKLYWDEQKYLCVKYSFTL